MTITYDEINHVYRIHDTDTNLVTVSAPHVMKVIDHTIDVIDHTIDEKDHTIDVKQSTPQSKSHVIDVRDHTILQKTIAQALYKHIIFTPYVPHRHC